MQKVINIHTIKPLDEELVVAAAKETGKVVTVEEHSVIGGLGSAVCDVLAAQAPTKVLKIGINDTLWRVRTGSRTGKEIRTGCRQHLRKGKRILQIRFVLSGNKELPEVAWNCRFREFFVLNLNNRPPKVVAGTASAPEEIHDFRK